MLEVPHLGRNLALAATGAATVFAFAQTASAAESKGFVINWFTVATIATKANCPDGLNPLSDIYYRNELKRLGYAGEEVEKLMKDFPSGGYVPLITNRGRIDGKPVNIYANPFAQPDPNIKLVKGKDGYGFNLDAKIGPNDFIDPETKETGVDNGYFRAVGCTHNYHISAPDYALYPYAQWDGTRDTSGAWLVEFTGLDSWENDDDVTVTIDKAIDTIIRDANSNVVRNMTFRADDSSRSKSVVQAKIVNGQLMTEPFTMDFATDPAVMPEFHLDKARLRAKFTPDGSIHAYLGGYHDWMKIYWALAQGGWTVEHANGVDMAGNYYALKKLADFDPDPESGQNRAISATWSFDAVPAYIVHLGTIASK